MPRSVPSDVDLTSQWRNVKESCGHFFKAMTQAEYPSLTTLPKSEAPVPYLPCFLFYLPYSTYQTPEAILLHYYAYFLSSPTGIEVPGQHILIYIFSLHLLYH